MAQTARNRFDAPTHYPRDWAKTRVLEVPRARKEWSSKTSYVFTTPKPLLQIVKSPELPTADEATFHRLSNSWRKETAMHSSMTKKALHPAYQRIIGMGPAAIPFIIREMKRKPGHWFWALDAVTQGENPAKDSETLTEATRAWIAWGEAKGYL